MRAGFGMTFGVLLFACSSSNGGGTAQGGSAGAAGASSGGTSSGGTSSGGASGASERPMVISGANAVTGFGLNDRCLPNSAVLPLASTGLAGAACRMILTGVTGGCTQPGLSAASAADIATIMPVATKSGETTLAQPICQLTEVNGGLGEICAAAPDSGWCYVSGPCNGDTTSKNCAHALCATPALLEEKLVYDLPPWLVCD